MGLASYFWPKIDWGYFLEAGIVTGVDRFPITGFSDNHFQIYFSYGLYRAGPQKTISFAQTSNPKNML